MEQIRIDAGTVEVPGIPQELTTVSPPEATAAVVVVPGVHGRTRHIEGVAHRLAGHGFRAVVADWFCPASDGGLDGPGAIAAAVRSIDDDKTAQGLASLTDHLAGEGPVAVLGYCVGATMALLASARTDRPAGVVAYYGVLRYRGALEGKGVDPLDALAGASCPVLGHFGLADGWIPPADVDELEAHLLADGVPNELYRYPGAGHAFEETGRPGYRPVAAADSARRTLAFLEHHLEVEP